LHCLDVRDLIVVLVDTAIEIEPNQPIETDEIPDDSVVLRRVPNPDESRSKQLKRLVREMLSPTPHFGEELHEPLSSISVVVDPLDLGQLDLLEVIKMCHVHEH
jgi:hypothetical protein